MKPFVGGNKSDVHDARAIWTAVQQPGVKAVALKSEEQQAILALHRMGQQLVKFRTAQINGLRGLLTEYGEVMARGKPVSRKASPTRCNGCRIVVDTLREQWARIGKLEEEMSAIERRLKAWHKEDAACQRIRDIPGVGLLIATAAVATMGEAKAFASGREFAAWLGLVPRQTGTGGRIHDCWGEPSAVTLTCAPYSFTGHVPC